MILYGAQEMPRAPSLHSYVFCFGFTADMHFRAAASSAPTTTRGSPGRGSRPRARSLRGMESWVRAQVPLSGPPAGARVSAPGRGAPAAEPQLSPQCR